jgi:hypothetical protein
MIAHVLLVLTKVNKRTQFQHHCFVKDIYAKTILPIYMVPHLKIFPMKNNIFILHIVKQEWSRPNEASLKSVRLVGFPWIRLAPEAGQDLNPNSDTVEKSWEGER